MRRSNAAHHVHPGFKPHGYFVQRFAGRRFRPLHQSVPRLRAWLRLLFRAPVARLARVVAGSISKAACLQAGRAGTAQERTGRTRLSPARSQSASTPTLTAGRKKIQNHARILELLVECRHPFSIVTKSAPDRARYRSAGRGRWRTSWYPRRVHHDTRPSFGAPHGTARRGTAAPGRGRPPLSAAGVPVSVLVAPLIPVLTDGEMEKSWKLRTRRVPGRQAMCCCACRTS